MAIQLVTSQLYLTIIFTYDDFESDDDFDDIESCDSSIILYKSLLVAGDLVWLLEVDSTLDA